MTDLRFVPGYGLASIKRTSLEGVPFWTWHQEGPGVTTAAICLRPATVCEGYVRPQEIAWDEVLEAMRLPPVRRAGHGTGRMRLQKMIAEGYPEEVAQAWRLSTTRTLQERAVSILRRTWTHGPEELRQQAMALLGAKRITAGMTGEEQAA